MKKNSRRFIASAAALGLLSTGAVFAADAPVSGDAALPSQPVTEPAAPAVRNGGTINSVAVREVNGVKMIPLRQVGEELGYTVNWNGENESIELVKGAQYITMSINEDAYAISRRAHQSLGAAPTLVDDSVTYVPLAFITDIIGGYYSENEDGSYKIVNPSIVTVNAVNEDGSLTVTDSYLGEVIVRIGEATKITGGGKEAKAEDIKADMVLAVEYSPAMTASIPPQTTAVTINIENLPAETPDADQDGENQKQTFTFEGEITDITDNLVTIGNPHEDSDAVRLVVSDETQITKGNDKRIYKLDDLKVGMDISGTHEEATTMSIPPQTAALTIEIEAEDGEDADELEAVEYEGKITEINGDMVTVGTPFEDNDAVVLIVTEDTKITKGDDKRLYKLDDLKVGMEISGTHSPISTRSLPPQTVAFTIEIDD